MRQVAKLTRGTFLIALFIAWGALVATAFIAYITTPPTGDGFKRGFNRVSSFIFWQFGAMLVAISVWRVGLSYPSKTLIRWLSRLPILLILIPALFMILIFGWVVVTA